MLCKRKVNGEHVILHLFCSKVFISCKAQGLGESQGTKDEGARERKQLRLQRLLF